MAPDEQCSTAISENIRILNDAFRRTFTGGKIMWSAGLSFHRDFIGILNRVRTFTAFNEHNDPHHEHDMGAFKLDREGELVMWKIDYYDKDLNFGSPDPSDPEVTTRVLTIFYADEY